MIRQQDKIQEIEDYEKKDFIEVLNIKRNDSYIGEDIYKKGVLIKNNFILKELETYEFNHFTNLTPYCDIDGNYFRFGLDYAEEIVYFRYNPLTKNWEILISDEFIIFHNLFKKGNNYVKIDDSYNTEEVIQISDINVKIKKKYLKQYLAIKDMSLVICFEYRYYSKDEIEEVKDEIIKKENTIYDYFINNIFHPLEYKSLGMILGKKIIRGIKKEDTNLWEYEKEEKFCEFIIGCDENGNEIKNTCDKKKLGNRYFNDIEPDFLTPVFFRKEVLHKYYQNDNIEVLDNQIRSLGWILPIDNQRDSYVSVYLGDLSILPYDEQQYWKSFNIVLDEKITNTSFKRDFKAEWAKPEALDLLLKYEYKEINKKWESKFKWKLFKELHNEDKHNFSNLRIPINNSQEEFDSQILSLVKLLIDSLNENEIEKFLTEKGIPVEGKGIQKLSIFLKSLLKDSFKEELDNHIQNLKDLQNLRSTGSGHRKGTSYEKLIRKLNLKSGDYQNNFKYFLNNTLLFFKFLENFI